MLPSEDWMEKSGGAIEVANGNLEFRGFDLIRVSLDTATEKKLPLIPPNRIGISATQSWAESH